MLAAELAACLAFGAVLRSCGKSGGTLTSQQVVKEGEVWGKGVLLPSRLRDLGSVISSLCRVSNGTLAKIKFGAF